MKKREGFTLIEIMLFLAITAILFMGVIMGVGNSLQQQRFEDSVQSFAEFLKSIYSQVSNPQSEGHGNSNRAIYGKLITFGETVGLDGKDINDGDQRIFVYDVVADVENSNSGLIDDVLSSANVSVIKDDVWTAGNKYPDKIKPAGLVREYKPRWSAAIETTRLGEPRELFVGAILVVRHPRSGTINTLVMDNEGVSDKKTIEVNALVRDYESRKGEAEYKKALNLLRNYLDMNKFVTKQVDFCVDPVGVGFGSDLRRDIRIVLNARNASGVEIIDMDLNEVTYDPQMRKNIQTGNRCRFNDEGKDF